MNKTLFFSLFLILAACASRPKLYPNETYKAVGKKSAEKDIDQCIKDGDEYMDTGKGKDIAKGAGTGAALGVAFGAVTGMFGGGIGRGIVRGGATGAVVGGTAGALSPDQVKRNYVNECLGEKGYRVLGWD